MRNYKGLLNGIKIVEAQTLPLANKKEKKQIFQNRYHRGKKKRK